MEEERGIAFMPALVPSVLAGAKTVTRRTGRRPAEVGDLLWIREAWATHVSLDSRPTGLGDTEWWRGGWGTGPSGPIMPPVWYSDDRDPHPGEWRGARGRPRQARFLPRDLARPWRGRVVSVEWVPAPPYGIDDAEAIREGARLVDDRWTLDDEDTETDPRAALLAGWGRLHPDAPSHCWRVEWVPHV